MNAFLAVLNKCAEKFKTDYKLTEGKAFGMWLATECLDLDENDAFEAVSVDGGNDKDIDFFFVDDSMFARVQYESEDEGSPGVFFAKPRASNG